MQIGPSNPYLSTFTAAATRSSAHVAAPTEAGSFAAALTAAGKPVGAAGASTVGPTAQLSESDKMARQKLSHLTDGDRALVNAALGATLTANGADGQGLSLAPLSVWRIAADRENGRLPAGQPITAAYLTEQRRNVPASAEYASLAEQYDKLLAALNGSSSRQPMDIRA